MDIIFDYRRECYDVGSKDLGYAKRFQLSLFGDWFLGLHSKQEMEDNIRCMESVINDLEKGMAETDADEVFIRFG